MESHTLLETLLTDLETNTSVVISNEYITSKIREVIDQLRKDKDASITWSVADFEGRARDIELREKEVSEMDCEKYLTARKMPRNIRMFDRKKFRTALNRMIAKHDATLGITWDTVDTYLHIECPLT